MEWSFSCYEELANDQGPGVCLSLLLPSVCKAWVLDPFKPQIVHMALMPALTSAMMVRAAQIQEQLPGGAGEGGTVAGVRQQTYCRHRDAYAGKRFKQGKRFCKASTRLRVTLYS